MVSSLRAASRKITWRDDVITVKHAARLVTTNVHRNTFAHSCTPMLRTAVLRRSWKIRPLYFNPSRVQSRPQLAQCLLDIDCLLAVRAHQLSHSCCAADANLGPTYSHAGEHCMP